VNCPHSEATAVLAAFGEAPEDFNAHLMGCPECQATVNAHTETLATLAPTTISANTPTLPPAFWRRSAAVLAVAAVALLAMRALSPGPDAQHQAIDSPVTEALNPQALELSFESTVDSDISDLELELALMSLE